ncbi:MAG: response regulator transcription factor [Anaerolineae bacterium]|jgi:two-component system response regulator RpaA
MAQDILIVDDDRQVAEAMQRALEPEFDVRIITEASQTLEACQAKRPDLIIMDITFPEGRSGLNATQQVRNTEALADIPILYVSGWDEIEDKEDSFASGGDDFLSKPFQQRELQLKVKALLRRVARTKKQPVVEVLRVGLLELNARSFEITTDSKKVLLTPVEFELMRFLMTNPDEVFSADQLLQRVWGYPPGIGMPDLVRVHVKNVREKIEPNPRKPIFLRNVLRRGYMVPTTTVEDVERVTSG